MTHIAAVTDWASDFDVMDPRYLEDPFSIWDELRQTCPIPHTNRRKSSWMPLRYEDVTAIAHDIDHFSSLKVAVIPGDEDEDPANFEGPNLEYGLPPISSDPPLHTWTRRLLLPWFSHKRVESYIPLTRDLCRRLLDGFAGNGRADAAADYAQQIPVRVIAHILGVSPDLSDTFTGWVRDVLEFADDPERRQRGAEGLLNYFLGQLEDRRRNPGDDLLSELLTTEVDGHPVDDGIVLGMAALVLIAGVDTTWSAIGSSLWHLATHPDGPQAPGGRARALADGARGAAAGVRPGDHGARGHRGLRLRRLPHEGGGQGADELPRGQPGSRGFRAPRDCPAGPGAQPACGVRLGDPPLRRVELGPYGAAGGARGVARADPGLLARRERGDHVGRWAGPRPAQTPGGVLMKIRVDPDKCQGHARCYGLAPEIFDVDDYGQASVIVDEVPPELEEKARLAVANCPEYAIEIISE